MAHDVGHEGLEIGGIALDRLRRREFWGGAKPGCPGDPAHSVLQVVGRADGEHVPRNAFRDTAPDVTGGVTHDDGKSGGERLLDNESIGVAVGRERRGSRPGHTSGVAQRAG